jgi:hypothetical protein
MTVSSLLDAAGRRRSPATLPGYHAGRPPRNQGLRYPADPPTVDEIVAVMRHSADDRHGWRVRATIVVLGAPACPSRKRSRSPSTTSTTGADRSWSAAATVAADAKSAWTSEEIIADRPHAAGPDDVRRRRTATLSHPRAGARRRSRSALTNQAPAQDSSRLARVVQGGRVRASPYTRLRA